MTALRTSCCNASSGNVDRRISRGPDVKSTAVRLCATSFASSRQTTSEIEPSQVSSSTTSSLNPVSPIRRNWIYAPGRKSRGRLPSISMPPTVGVGSSTEAIIFAAARRSRDDRSLFARSVALTAWGRYSSSNRLRSKSWIVAERRGVASKCLSWVRRFSFRIRSSCAVATARRGPTRIQMRPL